MSDANVKQEADFYFDLGQSSLKEHKIEEAIAFFEIALKKAPQYPYIYDSLSHAYVENREYDKAVELWQNVRTACSGNFPSLPVDPVRFCGQHLREVKEHIERRKKLDKYRDLILSFLRENPGFVQSEIYREIKADDPHVVGYAIWELEREGVIRKERYARSFRLYIS
jgi:tetratricopeptide (TPR) repeat protein